MNAPTLVVEPMDSSSAVAGTLAVESITDLGAALESGSWLDVGLSAATVALDTAAMAIDPIGQLLAMGLGWVLEHVDPLKGWLEDLTGDADAVHAAAATWDAIGSRLDGAAQDYTRLVHADLEAMAGEAIEAYRRHGLGVAAELSAVGGAAESMGSALRLCATVVQVVHDLVRDALAQVAGSAIAWAAEIALTAGVATPLVAAQVSTKVASLTTRLASKIASLVASARALSALADELAGVLSRAGRGRRADLPVYGARWTDPRDLSTLSSHALGGRPRDMSKWSRWAERTYEFLRSDEDLARKVAAAYEGPGDRADVQRALRHLLHDTHMLENADGGVTQRRFDADAGIAEALLRLSRGEPRLKDHVLIEHEMIEENLFRTIPGITYREAHQSANALANWETLETSG